MTRWISSTAGNPPAVGWYSTLSNWGTANRHPGAQRWLGTKWASSCPHRIEFYSPVAFPEPHAAARYAFTHEAQADGPASGLDALPAAAAAG